MDVLTTISFIIDIAGRISGAWRHRPKLDVRILSIRLDRLTKRWVVRASVINRGGVKAQRCEGYWSVFNASLIETESAMQVFWSPLEDDDYNFEDRDLRMIDLEPSERRFCWAELQVGEKVDDIPGFNLFPSTNHVGPHILTIIIEYGTFKSFNYVVLYMPDPFKIGGLLDDSLDVFDVAVERPSGLREYGRWRKLNSIVRQIDYHNYVRPT